MLCEESEDLKVAKKFRGTFLGTITNLLEITGWQSLVILTVGSICAALNGGMLVLRIILVSSMFDDYVGWSKYSANFVHNLGQIKNFNASNTIYFIAKPTSYYGERLKTDSEFVESMSQFSEHYYILGAISFALSFVQLASWEMINNSNVEKLRERFFTQAVRLDVTWHDQLSRDNDLNTRLLNDLECVRNNLGAKMSLMIYSTACLVGSIAIGFHLHWKLGVINSIGIAIMGASTLIYGWVLSKASTEEHRIFRKIGNVVSETLTSLKMVKSFGRENYELSRFEKVVREGRSQSSRKHFIYSMYSAINSCFPYAIISAVTCCAAGLIMKREVSPGHYIGMVSCVLSGAPAFTSLLPIWSDIVDALTSFTNLIRLTEIEPHVDPLSDLGVTIFDTKDDICFKNVSYSYPSRKEVKVLKDISLKIPKLRTVAIVGPSGSGKSTIINLILRLFDPDSGKVTLGFTDLRVINLNLLRKKIGVVSQDATLFDTTIEENIRCGNLEATFDDVINAAELANAHAFIMNLPNGYKTLVGERGCSLSGGQKQRIAIARALIRDPDILLLDEATSALDSHNEQIVRKTLETAIRGRTTVIVTHKLSTVKKADFIYVVKDGNIVEAGGYNELILQKGYFYLMLTQGLLVERRKRELPMESVKSPKEYPKKSERCDSTDVTKKKGTLKFLYSLSPHWMSLSALVLSVLAGLHSSVYIILFNNNILRCFEMPLKMSSKILYDIGIDLIYLALAVAVINVLMNLSAFLSTDRMIKELRIRMFRSLINQNVSFYDNRECSPIHVANDVIQQPVQLSDIAGCKGAAMISGITLIVSAVTTSMVSFWQMSLVQSAFLLPVFIVSYCQIAFKMKVQTEINALSKKASKWASECFDNIKTVHCLGLHAYVIEIYQKLCSPLKTGLSRDVLVYALSFAASCSINLYYFFAISISFATSLVAIGTGSMDNVFTNSYNFLLSFAMISGLVVYFQDFSRSKSAIVGAVHSASLLDREGSPLKPIIPITLGKIEFINVHFKYANEDNYALKGFNLTINAGETVGIVGYSGHGKSTVVKLIEKFYSPTEGQILIDGENIDDIDEHYLRSKIGLVLQEPQLFNATIRENILYGLNAPMSDVSDEEIAECCRQADIYDFITMLPQRLETVLGARGSQLSGGQKQKIAVARALIRKPEILLLDEATSALDVESEKVLLSGLMYAAPRRTTIIVTHRLSTVRNADVIAVVENGEVTEKGSHEELVELQGRYCSMLQ